MNNIEPEKMIEAMVEDALLCQNNGAEIGEVAKIKKQQKLMEQAEAFSKKLRLLEWFQEVAAQTGGRVEVSQLRIVCTAYCAVGYTIVVPQGEGTERGGTERGGDSPCCFPILYAGSDGFLSGEAKRFPTYGFGMLMRKWFFGYNEKMLDSTLRKTIVELVKTRYISPAARNG